MTSSLFSAARTLLLTLSWVSGQAPNISGTITDSTGAPLAGASVRLERAGIATTSGSDGTFLLTATTSALAEAPRAMGVRLHSGKLFLELPYRERVYVEAYGVGGRVLGGVVRDLPSGTHALPTPGEDAGIRIYRVRAGGYSAVVPGLALGGGGPLPIGLGMAREARAAQAKAAGAEMYDMISVTKGGYTKGYLAVSKAETTGVAIKLLKTTSPKFSFFVTSMQGLIDLSKNDKGFGGDLRFGETGPGAGLRGADKICATLAERSMPGAYYKGWRAFLSVTADADGRQVNAIDRIGAGPWYDRLGRVFAPSLNEIRNMRPQKGDPTIQNDFPNETGTLNKHPGPEGEEEDNHHMLTGSTTAGTLKSASATCKDWTTSVHSAANGRPFCGLSFPRVVGTGEVNTHWISAYEAWGCAPGIEITITRGASQQAKDGGWVGGGGGYGGFYCFALNP